jgi:membrane-associated phospholipid phosphatase
VPLSSRALTQQADVQLSGADYRAFMSDAENRGMVRSQSLTPLAVLCFFVGIAPLQAQPAGPEPTPRHTGIHALFKDLGHDVKQLPSRENLIWASIGGALALGVHPFDDNVNHFMVGNTTAKRIFKPGAVIGSTYTLLATSVGVYGYGRATDEPKVSHLGMDLLQALAVSGALTQTLKFATHRERPDGSTHNSFPSGHASDTFAFATALERHLGWRGAAPAFAVASYVAISRLPANRHWLSDVVFGSAVGVIAGRTVTGSERNKYPVTVVYVPGGAGIFVDLSRR